MKPLRQQLHLSQKEMASLLGVSTAAICLIEKGQRNLSSQGTINLSQLQVACRQCSSSKSRYKPTFTHHQKSQYLKIEKRLKAMANKAAADAVRLTIILSNMKERHSQLTQKINVLQFLMQQALPATKQMSLLENMEIDTLEALNKCSVPRQLLTSCRLQILQATQAAVEQVQKQLKQFGDAVKN